eukprot:1293242-Amorphochlora_amoeboformis.AAC.1
MAGRSLADPKPPPPKYFLLRGICGIEKGEPQGMRFVLGVGEDGGRDPPHTHLPSKSCPEKLHPAWMWRKSWAVSLPLVAGVSLTRTQTSSVRIRVRINVRVTNALGLGLELELGEGLGLGLGLGLAVGLGFRVFDLEIH